jgi:hypothetical protein
METAIYKPIASTTYWLRLLNNVEVDKANRTCTYTKLGIRKTINGEKFEELAHLVNLNKYRKDRSRMAMCMRNNHTGKHYIVIDRTFYDIF